MSDTLKPQLKNLVIPSSIDVSKGSVTVRFAGEATDSGGAGVRDITVTLDKAAGLSYGASRYIFFGDSYGDDTFADATPSTAAQDVTFTRATAPGTYTVSRVDIEDNAGNVATYATDALKALGVNTAISITGGIADTSAPSLIGLTIPSTVDLSAGSQDIKVSVEAKDNDGGTGVDDVTISLDGKLGYTYGSYSFMLLTGTSLRDNFKDATPTVGSETFTLTSSTAPGTYNITQVTVSDIAGNLATYSAADLQALGIATSMTVKGGKADTTAPVLHKLRMPDTVDVSQGPASFKVSAEAQDGAGGSGIDDIVVEFDGELSFSYGTYRFMIVDGGYGEDNFKDSTPGTASETMTLETYTAPGIYNVTRVTITDIAGNATTYTPAQLKAMGMATSLTVTDGKPLPPPAAAPASVETLFQQDVVVHRVASTGWPETGGANFSLTFEYDASRASFEEIQLRGTGAASMSTQLTEIGGVGRVTLSGYAVGNGSAPFAIDVILKPEPGAMSFTYAVKSFTVDGKAQAFGASLGGSLAYGTPDADVFTNAGGLSTIDGGAGLDTAIFAGKLGSYQVDRTVDGTTVMDAVGHVVQLDGVERLQFADTSLALDIDGAAGRIYRLYQAAFDRHPDEIGIGYWMGRTDAGTSLNATAQSFIDSAEFTNLYGAGVDDAGFLDALYQNVLDRDADQGGFAFWSGKLGHGVSRADVLVEFSESAENVARVAGSIEDGFSYQPWG